MSEVKKETKQDSFIHDLIAAQKELKVVIETETNPHFKSKYESHKAVWEEVKRCFNPHNFFCTQITSIRDGAVILTTKFIHTSEREISCELPLLNPKGDMQGNGSAMTYAKRQTAKALAGISTNEHDDDGNASSQGPVEKPEQDSPNECQHKWMISKYHQGKEYCTLCKSLREMK